MAQAFSKPFNLEKVYSYVNYTHRSSRRGTRADPRY